MTTQAPLNLRKHLLGAMRAKGVASRRYAGDRVNGSKVYKEGEQTFHV